MKTVRTVLILVAIGSPFLGVATATGASPRITDFLLDVNHVIRVEENRSAQARAAEADTVSAVRVAAAAPTATPLPRIELDEADLVPVLQEHLKRRYNLSGDFRVSFARPWSGLKMEDRDWDVEIVRAPVEAPEALSSVRFRIVSGRSVLGEYTVTLQCEHWVDAWLTTTPLARRQALSPQAMQVRRIDLLRSPRDIVTADTDLSVYEVRQGLSPDRIVSWRDIVVRPLVRRGDRVEVIVQQGSLAISMTATALEDGAGGEMVSVRNASSNRDFQARVKREKTVEVLF